VAFGNLAFAARTSQAEKRSFNPSVFSTAFRLAKLGLPRRESWRIRRCPLGFFRMAPVKDRFPGGWPGTVPSIVPLDVTTTMP
jgi:hypothetical protein